MNTNLGQEAEEVMQAISQHPAVTIILPIQARIGVQKELTHYLKTMIEKAERELSKTCSEDVYAAISQKLRSIASRIHFDKGKKGLIIYVSPVFEKIIFVNVPLEERILVNESFDIRDLVYSKQQFHKYLVLLLSSKECKLYLGNTNTFIKLPLNIPETVYAYVNDVPERVANFSDISERKQIVVDKFLHHVNDAMSVVLQSYKLPLFVLGPEKILGHFKLQSKHNALVSQYIKGNYNDKTIPELIQILEPYIITWKKEQEIKLLKQLEAAENEKKLAKGIKNVLKEVKLQKGRLLVVEKNYMYPVKQEEENKKLIETHNKKAKSKDVVENIIEEVLKNGGDVELVTEDLLKDYQHIALIQYY